MASLTDKELEKALRDAQRKAKDIILTDAAKARGIGRLRVRARPSMREGGRPQALFYFRYVDSEGAQRQEPLGVYDPRGRAGLTLRGAREKAGELSKLYQGGVRDLRAHLDHQAALDRAEIERAAKAREEAERLAVSGSFKALLDAYVAYLESQGRVSAQDARNLFRRNITQEWPTLTVMRANEITVREVNAILSKLIERGAGRTAGKLRAYLRAAFTLALSADNDPTVPPSLRGFNLSGNPAAAVPAKALARFNVARERVLAVAELRGYLEALDRLPDSISRDALRLSLLLGGQRLAQLVRVGQQDLDLEGRTVTLFDAKGKRSSPRAHRLPLTDTTHGIFARLVTIAGAREDGLQPLLFSNTGKVPVRVETLSAVAADISKAMVKAKTSPVPFELRDIRRTCETELARIGVSRDIRAQLQSHGLGGVQQRHYDKHDYMDEKRLALLKWESYLESVREGDKAGAKVTKLPQARRARMRRA